jgi:hypothetical protein
MTTEQIIAMQKRVGAKPDGFWGPRSQEMCRLYLRTLMPAPNPWPASDGRSLRAFYGEPGEANLVNLAPPYPMLYEGKVIKTLRCHRKVADSLLRVLNSIKDLIAENPQDRDEAQDYGGCYNFRNKRGGTTLSLHAWGAAIDLDADDNTFRDSWPMKADMPLSIMEAFAREGWLSAGAFWGYDAMHFQATR